MNSLSSSGSKGSGRRSVFEGALPWMAAGLCAVLVVGCKNSHAGHPPVDGSTHVEIGDGSLRITPQFAECASVTLAVAPQSARVGGRISVIAHATGVADAAAASFTYRWTATGGSFADPNAAETSFTCPGADGAGPQTITLVASDGKCAVTRTATVSCYAFADAGAADRAAGDAAAAGGSGGGTQPGVGGSSGAGVGGAAGDNAGGGGGSGGAGGTCAGDPSLCEGAECNSCTDLQCYPPVPGPMDTTGCAVLASDADRSKCWAVYACIRDNSCTIGGAQSPDSTPCWCGDPAKVNFNACTAGTVPAEGPCRQQVIDAAKTSDPATINARWIDPHFPLGPAVSLAFCRAAYCGKGTDTPSCTRW